MLIIPLEGYLVRTPISHPHVTESLAVMYSSAANVTMTDNNKKSNTYRTIKRFEDFSPYERGLEQTDGCSLSLGALIHSWSDMVDESTDKCLTSGCTSASTDKAVPNALPQSHFSVDSRHDVVHEQRHVNVQLSRECKSSYTCMTEDLNKPSANGLSMDVIGPNNTVGRWESDSKLRHYISREAGPHGRFIIKDYIPWPILDKPSP
jgi:hypothetical protein